MSDLLPSRCFFSSSRQAILQSPDALLLHVEQSCPSTTGSSVPPFVNIEARAATIPSTTSEEMQIRANFIRCRIRLFACLPRSADMIWLPLVGCLCLWCLSATVVRMPMPCGGLRRCRWILRLRIDASLFPFSFFNLPIPNQFAVITVF